MLSVFSCKENYKKSVDQKLNTTIKALQVQDINLSSGSIKRIENFPSQFVQTRNVDIWLPGNYSENKKYSVLYMHDGQMLFDATTTWNKQEWKVDEWASKMMNEGLTSDFIVVAMWNISEIRWQDYFPQKAFNFLSEHQRDSIINEGSKNNFVIKFNADNYLKFITKEVKPYIDDNYSVLTDKSHTFISGSSMGGLISMYALCEYPDVFGAAACISTHWPGATTEKNNPIPDAFFAYMKEHVPEAGTHKWYFDYGTETLDQFYPQYKDEVDQLFKDKGYTKEDFVNLKFDGMDHSENSWNQRLDVPLTFLFGQSNE
jgi:enterochelin esterase-like enzyme